MDIQTMNTAVIRNHTSNTMASIISDSLFALPKVSIGCIAGNHTAMRDLEVTKPTGKQHNRVIHNIRTIRTTGCNVQFRAEAINQGRAPATKDFEMPCEVKPVRHRGEPGLPPLQAVVEHKPAPIALIQDEDLSMTSQDIADLLGSRHDNVKTTVERLVNRGVITSPAMQEKPRSQGRPGKEYIFQGEQGKRDSIIVVAQLSPEFTAKLVDRWQELEAQVAKPKHQVPTSFLEAMKLATELEEKRLVLEHQVGAQAVKIAEDAPKVEFYDAVAMSKVNMSMKEVSDILGIGRTTLFKRLRDDGILINGGKNKNLPYQAHKDAGRFVVALETYQHPHTGELMTRSTLTVTGKGLIWLRDLMEKNYVKDTE